MSTFNRLTQVYNASERIPIDETSKIVFISDVHRGDNSKADNFAPNKDIYKYALEFYFDKGYTYIEIGDGEELWENRRFTEILKAHRDVYALLDKFHNSNRLHMIWGNHDMVKRNRSFIFRNVRRYTRDTNTDKQLFENMISREGLILKHERTQNEIFVVHGHQGDLLNDYLWFVACFLVRYIWRRFEYLRNRNPVSPAANRSKLVSTETGMKEWVSYNKIPLIAGHTHSVAFPWSGDVPYFNDGCCVKEGYFTGIEISNDEIMLVKWFRDENRSGGTGICRQVMAGPVKLEAYY